ncbi:MAG TPA: C-GCAxxG-C-C family protein [Phycisphaerae bacterium]|nr:C-GCAxxG-C-C family protein [Phycisphaerae bacterium]
MRAIAAALARHTEGFNCSQSVLAAFAEELGLPLPTALRLAAPFGGGVGRRGEVCGAATGALLALGMKFDCGTTDKVGKEATYVMAAEFLRRFEAATGHLLCRDLIGYDLSIPEELAAARSAKVFETTCHGIIATATEIAAGMLQLPDRPAC